MIWAIATIKNSGAVFVSDKEPPTIHGPVVILIASSHDDDQESWIMMASRTDRKVRLDVGYVGEQPHCAEWGDPSKATREEPIV
jgi:hypothetical protein